MPPSPMVHIILVILSNVISWCVNTIAKEAKLSPEETKRCIPPSRLVSNNQNSSPRVFLRENRGNCKAVAQGCDENFTKTNNIGHLSIISFKSECHSELSNFDHRIWQFVNCTYSRLLIDELRGNNMDYQRNAALVIADPFPQCIAFSSAISVVTPKTRKRHKSKNITESRKKIVLSTKKHQNNHSRGGQ